jgi:hypothetical protein
MHAPESRLNDFLVTAVTTVHGDHNDTGRIASNSLSASNASGTHPLMSQDDYAVTAAASAAALRCGKLRPRWRCSPAAFLGRNPQAMSPGAVVRGGAHEKVRVQATPGAGFGPAGAAEHRVPARGAGVVRDEAGLDAPDVELVAAARQHAPLLAKADGADVIRRGRAP